MPSESCSRDQENNKVLDSTLHEEKKSGLSLVTSPYLLTKFLKHATGAGKRKSSSTLSIPMKASVSIPSVHWESSSPCCLPADRRLYDPPGTTLWVSDFDRMSLSDRSDLTPEEPAKFASPEPLTPEEEPVSLPGRYKARLAELSLGPSSAPSDCDQSQSGHEEDPTSREEDLTTALRWIRQEILQMKEQDKSLQKQFIELRTSILQLRCLYEMHSSYSDISSLEGSTYSLNEPVKSPKIKHLLLGNDGMNKLSVSLPSSPMVERFKWRNDEYM